MTDIVLIFWISLPCAFVGFAAKWKQQKKRISHFNIISYVDSLIQFDLILRCDPTTK